MGGKGDVNVPENPYEQALANLIQQAYQETVPLRTEITRQLTDFAHSSEMPGYYSPVYEAGKQAIETQYQIARENLISQLPKSGALTAALADLEASRAATLGGLRAQIAQDLANKAFGYATGVPGQAISGYGTLAGTYGSRQAAAMAAQAQQAAATRSMLGQLGMAAGWILGGKL
jgi:hypothetical protein